MRIKNPIIFIFLFLMLFGTKSFCLEPDFFTTMPSQLSVISVKYYFQNFLNSGRITNSIDPEKQKIQQEQINQTKINFLKEIYNEKDYKRKLSHDGSDIVDILELSKKLNLNAEYDCTWLRLFYNKYKEIGEGDFIHDTVLIQVLESLSNLLERHFRQDNEYNAPTFDYLKEYVEKLLLNKFTEHLSDFQNEPSQFLSDLSTQIGKNFRKETKKAEKITTAQEDQFRLKQSVIKLLEIMTSKVGWSLANPESIWSSVIEIANGFQNLGTHGILDHMDDLDDLQKTLTLRFCYFLKVAGAHLPTTFYDEVENDLKSRIVFFLESEEQDEGLISKKEILLNAIKKAKNKAVMFEKTGVFSDQIV
ncbi:hypothetical protein K9M16_02865 [Candidatus Babeliales bacterium]|nr:hypothetical protein [Candidatus Babeliales bacterium]